MEFKINWEELFKDYEHLVTTEEASKMLTVNTTTIRELISSNELLGLKVGRNYRIPKKVIIEFLKMQEKKIYTK